MSNSHSISMEQASAMTAYYRQNRPDNFAICETFDAAQVKLLFENPDCISLRIYYGMKADKTVHAILVGADAEGNDLIPVKQGNGNGDTGYTGLLEEAVRCPDTCPPDSPLNLTS